MACGVMQPTPAPGSQKRPLGALVALVSLVEIARPPACWGGMPVDATAARPAHACPHRVQASAEEVASCERGQVWKVASRVPAPEEPPVLACAGAMHRDSGEGVISF